MAAKRRTRYRILRGLRYQMERPDGTRGSVVRRPAGEIVTDLPTGSVPWLLEQGIIEPATRRKAGEEVASGDARQ